MKFRGFFTKKRIFFILLFTVLVFIGSRINFSPILGAEKQYFTLFQFFGPVAGGFLGPVLGTISVLFAEIANFFIAGKAFNFINLFRLTPMLFAAFYFGLNKKRFYMAIVPLLCMFLFIIHPIGNQVWFYSMYWLIPVIALFFKKNLFAKSIGATFTAHAIGSTIWLYTIPMEPGVWLSLIPIVMYERLMFSAGIVVSYVVFNTVLDKLDKKVTDGVVHTEPRYVLSKRLFRLRA